MAPSEYIDLLSSPEPVAKKTKASTRGKPVEKKQKSLFFGSEDSDNEAPPPNRVTKPTSTSKPAPSLSPLKRNSPTHDTSRAKRIKSPPAVLILSDDDDILPVLPAPKSVRDRKENTPPNSLAKPRDASVIRLSPSPIPDLGNKANTGKKIVQKSKAVSADSDSDDIPDFSQILQKAKDSPPKARVTSVTAKVSMKSTNIGHLSETTKKILASLERNDEPDPIVSSSQPSPPKSRKKLPSIADAVNKPTISKSGSSGASNITTGYGRELSEDPIPSSQPKARKGKLTEEEKAARAEEKAREKERKDIEKAKEKARKEAEKEEKAREKAEANRLKDVNKNKTRSLEDTMPEMIVDISPSYATETAFVHLEKFLTEQKCGFTSDKLSLSTPPVGHTINWRRKVVAEYDYDQEMFMPLQNPIVRKERHILCILTAVEYLELTSLNHHGGLKNHIARLVSSHPEGGIPIYVIEGMQALINKMKAKEQREWRNQALGTDAPASSQSRRSKDEKKVREQAIIEKVTPEKAEDALLDLQFVPGSRVLMHQTNTPMETAEWILTFTREVARGYYRAIDITAAHHGFERSNKCGTDPDDTFYKMLQEITRVTPSIANGVMSEVSSVQELIRLCQRNGKDFAADLKNMATRTGAPTNGRRIGPACSSRIYTAFMATDPNTENV